MSEAAEAGVLKVEEVLVVVVVVVLAVVEEALVVVVVLLVVAEYHCLIGHGLKAGFGPPVFAFGSRKIPSITPKTEEV